MSDTEKTAQTVQDTPLTIREHLDPDKHWIGEALAPPTQTEIAATIGSVSGPGDSPFVARADHLHRLDFTLLDGRYVNVSGDTMSGYLLIDSDTTVTQLVLQGGQTDHYFTMRNAAGTDVGRISWDNSGNLTFYATSGYAAIVSPTASIYLQSNGVNVVIVSDNGIIVDGWISVPSSDFVRVGGDAGAAQGTQMNSGFVNSAMQTFNFANYYARRRGGGGGAGQPTAPGQPYFQCIYSASSATITDAVVGGISIVNATTVAFNTTSDEDEKDNIKPVPDASAEKIMRDIQPMMFNWKHTPGTTAIGYIAQRIAEVFPGAVDIGLVTPPNDDPETGHGWMTDPSKIVPILHAGWQSTDRKLAQAISEIQSLKQRVAALEGV